MGVGPSMPNIWDQIQQQIAAQQAAAAAAVRAQQAAAAAQAPPPPPPQANTAAKLANPLRAAARGGPDAPTATPAPSPPPPPPPPAATTAAAASASDPLCIVANEGETISVNPPANGYLKAPSVAWYARNDNFSPENYIQGTCNTYPVYSGAWGANTYVLDLISGYSRYGRKTVGGQTPRVI